MLLPGIYGRETRAEEKGTETILTEGTSKQNIYVQNLPALPAFYEFLRSEIRVIIYIFRSTEEILSPLKIIVSCDCSR